MKIFCVFLLLMITSASVIASDAIKLEINSSECGKWDANYDPENIDNFTGNSPWHASLYKFESSESFCGAALVSENIFITSK